MMKIGKGGLWLSGILLTLLLLAVGLLFDSVFGQLTWIKLMWPGNVYFYSAVLAVGLIVGALSDKEVLKQLASMPALLPSAVLLCLSGILLMLFPLGEGVAYFSHLLGLPLLIMLVYTVFISGVFIAKRFKSYAGIEKLRFVSLIGYLVFAIATVGTQRDFYKMNMRIGKDRAIFEGKNYDGRVYRTPFALKLLDLSLPAAELELVLKEQGNSSGDAKVASIALKEGETQNLAHWTVKVDKYLPKSVMAEESFILKDTAGCVAAAYVQVLDHSGMLAREGWVCTASPVQMPQSLDVEGQQRISLLYNKDQSVRANIRLFEEVALYTDHSLSGNEGMKYKGWTIKVDQFDARFGSAAPMMDMKLVFDRWMEVKYAALVLMVLGLLLLIKFKK